MCIVPPLDRLASASVVFLGQHGEVTCHAQQRGVSRQSLYRQADCVLRDLDVAAHRQEIARRRQRMAELDSHVQQLLADQPPGVVASAELQAAFASTAQAEGVSLPVARRLLAVLLRDQTPSVATRGRASHQAGLRAGPLLKVFDEHARPLARQDAGDEIFFGQKPVLMVVEPYSQCWLSGRLSPSRDGQEGAKAFEPLPALEHLVRDGGKGLQNGLARVNQRRRQEEKKPIGDQLDHFHRLREGRRGLRKTQAQAERAWTAAEEADKKLARQDRQGQTRTGYATQAVLKWQAAGEAGQQAVQAVRQALRCVGRASRCVEGLNRVLRMQQGRHRKRTQELLDLNRLYWNLRDFRTGTRKNTCPYQRLGVPLPPDLSWWQFLQLTPDQLRSLLSALPSSP